MGWGPKFDRNVARFERRFELCPFYDENQLPHGGPSPDRKRRDAVDEDELTSNDTTKMSHSSVSSRSLPVSENGPNDTLLNAKFNPADRSTVPTNGSTFSVKNTSPAN